MKYLSQQQDPIKVNALLAILVTWYKQIPSFDPKQNNNNAELKHRNLKKNLGDVLQLSFNKCLQVYENHKLFNLTV